MSILTPLTSIVLLLCGSTFSQISYPNCTLADFSWTYNSLNQNPCAVAAYLAGTCTNGAWSIGPIPPGWSYLGPNDYTRTNLCLCNSVFYSLISACAACQGGIWTVWPSWAFNCTDFSPPLTFPHPIPDGTRVPHWALLDIFIEENWNANKSRTAGDSPEISPGVLITAASSSPTPSPSRASSPNTGFIVAGIVGGLAIITIAAVVIFFLRRQRVRASSDRFAPITGDTAPFAVGGAPQPIRQGRNALADNVTLGPLPIPDSPTTPMGVYNPNNAATLPEPQDPNAPHRSVQALLEQYQATGNPFANIQASRQRVYRNSPGP